MASFESQNARILSRRAALRLVAATALTWPAAQALAAPLPKPSIRTAAPAARLPAWNVDPFTLGVASGAPRPDGFVLWTRLAPDPLNADPAGGFAGGDLEIRYEIADDPSFRRIAR